MSTSTAFGPVAGGDHVPMASFEIHRRSWLYIALVVVPLILAVAYGWFAYDRRDVVLAGIAIVLFLLALAFVPSLRDVKAPLLVADEHGVRLQGSQGWIGLLWSEIEALQVLPQRGLRGPRLILLVDQTPDPYVVPLGLATDCSPGDAEVGLAQRRDAARP